MNAAQYILVFSVRLYQWVVSPAKTFLFGPLGHCRFTPTCSAYALEAISHHGAMRGSWLAVKRLARCHPWGGCGHDPVPGSVAFRSRTDTSLDERARFHSRTLNAVPQQPVTNSSTNRLNPDLRTQNTGASHPSASHWLRSRISKAFPLARQRRGARI